MAIDKDWIGLLSSCCCSVILLEVVLRSTRATADGATQVGTLITCCQFLTVAALTVPGAGLGVAGGPRPPRPPLPLLLLLVSLFFSSSLLGNWAYELRVPVPVHALVKSGSLVCTALLNAALLGARYSRRRQAAMAAVSAGVALCGQQGAAGGAGRARALGVALLLLSLVLGAMTGLLQERLFRRHGCSFEAVLFASHALPLPFLFWFAGSSLREGYALIASSSGPFSGPALLISSCLAQYYCVTTVSRFAAKNSSVTVAFALTLRKFISIVISVFLFDATFTFVHWIGAALVFSGTVLYADDSGRTLRKRAVKT